MGDSLSQSVLSQKSLDNSMNDDLSHERVSVNDDDVKSLKSVSDGVPELD